MARRGSVGEQGEGLGDCGGWRWCRGWLDSWATARGCSRAAWGSGRGLGTQAEGLEGWSRTATA